MIPRYGYLTEEEIKELKKEMFDSNEYPFCYPDEDTGKPTYCESCIENYYNSKMSKLKSFHRK